MPIDERPPSTSSYYTTNASSISYTFGPFNIGHDGKSYEAVNEEPRVFCAYGPTPADALRAMAELLTKHKITTWSASSVNFDRDTHYLTIYL